MNRSGRVGRVTGIYLLRYTPWDEPPTRPSSLLLTNFTDFVTVGQSLSGTFLGVVVSTNEYGPQTPPPMTLFAIRQKSASSVFLVILVLLSPFLARETECGH